MQRTLLGPEPGAPPPILVGAQYRLGPVCPPSSRQYAHALQVTPDGEPLLRCDGALPNVNGGAVVLDGAREVARYVTGEMMVESLAQTSEGDVLLGGWLGSVTENGPVVAKYSDAGVLLWQDSWMGGNKGVTLAIAVAPDGSIYATGNANGIEPGKPNTVTVGRWIARYASDGDRIWLKQYPRYTASTGDTFVTEVDEHRPAFTVAPDGSLYAAGSGPEGDWLEVFDPDGELLRHTQAALDPVFDTPLTLDSLHASPDGRSLFSVRSRVLNLGLDGSLNWYGDLESHPAAPVAGGGSAPADIRPGTNTFGVLVEDDGLFLVGSYHEPEEPNAWVGRFDLEGNRLWVRQYDIAEDESSGLIARLPSGNLLVLLRTQILQDSTTGMYLLEIDDDDGQLR